MKPICSYASLVVSSLLTGLAYADDLNNEQESAGKSGLFFTESKDIRFENLNRRKWDSPVIADFDRDGYPDLLTTDHGYSVKLYWNNEGTFSEGFDVLVGDTHGITVGDYNKDGDLDLLISRGGGSGSNARNAKLFHVDENRQIIPGEEFNEPLRKMRGRTSKFVDIDNDGDLDLLLFGFPMGAASESENHVYENDGADGGNSQLKYTTSLPQTYSDGQQLLVTDFNNDSRLDLLIYGHGRVIAHQNMGGFQFRDVTDKIFKKDIHQVTGIAEIDFDNDGDFDLYFSRGKKLNAGDTFFDEETGTLAFYTLRQELLLPDLLMGDVFEMENYQAPWPDQQVFIGESAYEYKFTGEKHKGRDIELVSSDALGWPDKLDKKGLYIGYIGNQSWRVAVKTSPMTTGVIKGLKSCSRPASGRSSVQAPEDLLLENRKGKFVDVTSNAGLSAAEHITGVEVADFDNNGFQDLLLVRRGDLVRANKQQLFLNRGKGRFERLENHRIASAELGAIGQGAESFDYNLDGRVDIVYGQERGRWRLFENNPESGDEANYVIVSVGRSPVEQVSALGALVRLTACGKVQARRVGESSAPYTQGLDHFIHFGLGGCEEPPKAVVHWSNSETLSKTFVTVNVLETVGK